MDQQLMVTATVTVTASGDDAGTDRNQLINQLQTEYLEQDRTAYDAQAEILTKLIKLDKSNSEWHYLLYNTKKYQRKYTPNPEGAFSLPSKEEILAIAKAGDLDPDNPKVILGRCNVMLDFVKHHSVVWTGTICFGMGHFFNSAEGIIESVKMEARRALLLDPKSDVTNIGVFEIFANGLPPKLREPVYAKECLNNAIDYNPDSSKAHSRIASYYYQAAGAAGLSSEEKKLNLELAEEHYLRAVESDRKNCSITSLIDLLQSVYMGHNQVKCEELLKLNTHAPEWDDAQRSKLFFVEGLHHFVTGANQQGLDSWITSYKLDKRVIHKMKYMDRDGFRYGWPATLKAEQIFVILGQLKRSAALAAEDAPILVQFRESLGTQLQTPSAPKFHKGKFAFSGPRKPFAASGITEC